MSEETLTRKERLLLYNQFVILRQVHRENAEYYELCCDILQKGFEFEYHNIFDQIYSDSVSVQKCKFVMDVLDLHWALQQSYDALQDKGGLTPDDVRFPGFDGNNESDLLMYAKYLQKEGERWQDILQNRDLNSHFPTYNTYRNMLALWEQVAQKWRMNADEIRKITLGA